MTDLHLNLGAGDYPAPPPWVNVDTWAGANPDVVADICDLPFPDGSARAIYCGHVLEHLPLDRVPAALAEVRRVLAVDGLLCVVGPDYDRALAQNSSASLLKDIRDGGSRWPGDVHHWVATETITLEFVREAFPHATAVDVATLPPLWPCPYREVAWQCAILA